jgi:hypothetical protein
MRQSGIAPFTIDKGNGVVTLRMRMATHRASAMRGGRTLHGLYFFWLQSHLTQEAKP